MLINIGSSSCFQTPAYDIYSRHNPTDLVVQWHICPTLLGNLPLLKIFVHIFIFIRQWVEPQRHTVVIVFYSVNFSIIALLSIYGMICSP